MTNRAHTWSFDQHNLKHYAYMGEKLCNWGEPERAPHYRGLQDHVHRRPTDRPCPSHSRDTDTLHLSSMCTSQKDITKIDLSKQM